MAEKPSPTGFTKNRLEALTDGIFAFAMTLLVLNIEVPDVLPATVPPDIVQSLLASLYPDFIHYFIAFALLAGFWLMHHAYFDHFRLIDKRIVILNVISLALVAIVPFSTDLADTFSSYPLSAIVLELNVFLIGIVYYTQWRYASCRPHLCQRLEARHSALVSRNILILPAISLIAMAVAFSGVTWSTSIYLVTPIATVLASKI